MSTGTPPAALHYSTRTVQRSTINPNQLSTIEFDRSIEGSSKGMNVDRAALGQSDERDRALGEAARRLMTLKGIHAFVQPRR